MNSIVFFLQLGLIERVCYRINKTGEPTVGPITKLKINEIYIHWSRNSLQQECQY